MCRFIDICIFVMAMNIVTMIFKPTDDFTVYSWMQNFSTVCHTIEMRIIE